MLNGEGMYGMWVATADEDLIVYASRASRLHQDHIVSTSSVISFAVIRPLPSPGRRPRSCCCRTRQWLRGCGIDTVIPIVDLSQCTSWNPDQHAHLGTLTRDILNVATLLGWLVSTIVVLSRARLARTI
jgi:hypothetical protein